MPDHDIQPQPALATGGLSPVSPGDRIGQLDMLRGWAVLGILAVNAMAFAWPMLVMTASGDPLNLSGPDLWGDWATEVFFADKFRTLFSMLFGVSVFLVGGEREDDDRGRLLRRRLFWLGAFGAAHGAALWFGDILLHYAYCGFIMLLMRSWSARRLLWIGGAVSLLWIALATAGPLVLGALGPEFNAKFAANMPQVTQAQIEAAVAAYKAGYFMPNLTSWAMAVGFSLFLIPVTVPLMMVGLGLFKSGFLVGRAPAALYVVLVALGGAILAVDAWASLPGRAEASLPVAGLDDACAGLAPLVMLGYVSLLLLLSRFGLGVVTRRLQPVGRMAFSNYLSQSIIMASLFYLPWGPQWMGTMGPAELWPVVGAVWIVQLIWSPLWLSAFRYGPFEWLWRVLTYGRMLPLRK